MKSKKTYIGRAIGYELARKKTTQQKLSSICGLSQPTLAQIISSPVRISPQSLRALTRCWSSPDANGRVLIAHLRDEIARAGHDPENALEIRLPNGQTAITAAARDLSTIRDSIADPDVAALIHDIATILRRSPTHAEQPADRAAEEPGPEYSATQKKS